MTDTPTYVSVPAIADELNLPVTKVHQLIRDGQLVAVRLDGILRIPAEFVADGVPWVHLDIAGPAFNEGGPYGYLLTSAG